VRTIRKNILWLVLLGAGTALSETPVEGPPKAPTEAPPEASVDYGQLGAILGYVASDYATAVGAAGVFNPQEYAEQKGFLAEAVHESASLPADELDVRSLLQAAKVDADRAAPPAQIVPKVTEALRLLEQRHDLGQIPKQMPSAARGRQLYAEGCEACHAADGSGQTGLRLSTEPPDLTDRAQSGGFSPSRVFRAWHRDALVQPGLLDGRPLEHRFLHARPAAWCRGPQLRSFGGGFPGGSPGSKDAEDRG